MTVARSLLLGLGLWSLLCAPSVAMQVRETPRAVVELFTSQGCASCPPADKLLTELAAHEDIVALAFHVDYWDYIGWPDTFGTEANSDRQRDYAAGRGSSRIYTPQIVVNGTTDVVGSRAGEVHSALEAARLELPVHLSLENDMLAISIPGQAGLEKAMIWLVTYIDQAKVAIERGENAGKSMLYSQIVTGVHPMGTWEPGAGAMIRMPIGEMLAGDTNGLAVLVQQDHEGMPGRILGAGLFHP
ncbi:hypothetical protein GCM10007989_19740 [Devosia pacifica]|uniref:DUF1223 domain-containing protein n=1 Tax=Devosia pacifica TaxID=1335967 RepID=A0A918VTK1_9HYPH|nr:DUF1223 domain-containing protein [Devosia pacifica]GHA24143.1 hypothetical protein GCM10007989_19740 [Devosia pacifica]